MSIQIRKETPRVESLDEATRALVEIGHAQLRRGEGIPAEQVRINVRDRIAAWRLRPANVGSD